MNIQNILNHLIYSYKHNQKITPAVTAALTKHYLNQEPIPESIIKTINQTPQEVHDPYDACCTILEHPEYTQYLPTKLADSIRKETQDEKDALDKYYDDMAQAYQDYELALQFGSCHDEAWQQGINI